MKKNAQNSSIYRADGIKNPLYNPETDILSVLQRVSEKVSYRQSHQRRETGKGKWAGLRQKLIPERQKGEGGNRRSGNCNTVTV